MTPVLPERAGILRAFAVRVDDEHIATLSPEEMDFAMTLEGRRLLERLRPGSMEFRLSRKARELLGQGGGVE